jgi:hypothetical protein
MSGNFIDRDKEHGFVIDVGLAFGFDFPVDGGIAARFVVG